MRARRSQSRSLQNRKLSKPGRLRRPFLLAAREPRFLASLGMTIQSRNGNRVESEERREMTTPAFKRILLKLSGEALAANQGFGVESARIHEVAAELESFNRMRLKAGVVISLLSSD